jgi:hypothetical protein
MEGQPGGNQGAQVAAMSTPFYHVMLLWGLPRLLCCSSVVFGQSCVCSKFCTGVSLRILATLSVHCWLLTNNICVRREQGV